MAEKKRSAKSKSAYVSHLSTVYRAVRRPVVAETWAEQCAKYPGQIKVCPLRLRLRQVSPFSLSVSLSSARRIYYLCLYMQALHYSRTQAQGHMAWWLPGCRVASRAQGRDRKPSLEQWRR